MIPIIRWADANAETKQRILKRSSQSFSEIEPDVRFWINEIREKGDESILDYIQKFDAKDGNIGRFKAEKFNESKFQISELEIEHAYDAATTTLITLCQDIIW